MKDSDNKFYLAIWVIVFIVVGLILHLVQMWAKNHPSKSTYDYVQDYREEQDYYIGNGKELVEDWYGEDKTDFTAEDVEDAYNAGLEDGIEQTIDYYESLDD